MFLCLLTIVEIIFGGWLMPQNNLSNLGILRSVEIEFKHHYYGKDSVITAYSRDRYGFRGRSIFNRPEKIDILTVGGSTTDQKYIDDALTWQELLENHLHEAGKDLQIANAGVDGQSTHGHIKNFKLWFPQVKDLHPRFILFYIGINDIYANAESSYDKIEAGHQSTYQKLVLKIKDNSALFNLYRKIRGTYRAKSASLGHQKVDFSQYKYDTVPMATREMIEEFKHHNIPAFKERLKVLISYVREMDAEPIFMTQPASVYQLANKQIFGAVDNDTSRKTNGVDFYHFLNLLNHTIREICGNKYQVVELTSLNIWKKDDFYDWAHMTPKGTAKLADEIFQQIKDKVD